MYQNETLGYVCEQVAIPVSSILTIAPLQGQMEVQIRQSAGGTLMLVTAVPVWVPGNGASNVAATYAVNATIASGLGGNGGGLLTGLSGLYIVGTSEIIDLKYHKGPISLQSGGTTVTIQMIRTIGPAIQPA